MVRVDFHRGLGVRVVRGLEAQVREAEPREEGREDAHQVAEREAAVDDHALDLVELGQVRRVQVLVPEHAVDREVLGRPEHAALARRSLRQRRQHPRGHCRRVRPQHVPPRLVLAPIALVPEQTIYDI